jgi:hypothetical protein
LVRIGDSDPWWQVTQHRCQAGPSQELAAATQHLRHLQDGFGCCWPPATPQLHCYDTHPQTTHMCQQVQADAHTPWQMHENTHTHLGEGCATGQAVLVCGLIVVVAAHDKHLDNTEAGLVPASAPPPLVHQPQHLETRLCAAQASKVDVLECLGLQNDSTQHNQVGGAKSAVKQPVMAWSSNCSVGVLARHQVFLTTLNSLRSKHACWLPMRLLSHTLTAHSARPSSVSQAGNRRAACSAASCRSSAGLTPENSFPGPSGCSTCHGHPSCGETPAVVPPSSAAQAAAGRTPQLCTCLILLHLAAQPLKQRSLLLASHPQFGLQTLGQDVARTGRERHAGDCTTCQLDCTICRSARR